MPRLSYMSVRTSIGNRLAPKVTQLAPEKTAQVIHQALHRAIVGVGPLDGARSLAEQKLRDHDGDDKAATKAIIELHVRLAGAEGFVTNIGGLATMAVTVPASVSGLALVQCRMVAAVAHVRGYDLDEPRTRNAVLAALLGEDRMLRLIRRKQLPGTPMAIATAPVHDARLDVLVANEVAAELITRVAGKRLATVVGRRVPLVGGMVGAGADGYATWKIGRYADRELLRRPRH